MISGSNVVSLQGRLTADPEFVGNDSSIAKFSVAVDYAGKDSNDPDSNTGFFDVVMFVNNAPSGNFVERMVKEEKLTKGSAVSIVGSLNHSRWTGDQGRRSRIEIVAEHVNFAAGGRRNDDENSGGANKPAEGNQASVKDDNFLDF